MRRPRRAGTVPLNQKVQAGETVAEEGGEVKIYVEGLDKAVAYLKEAAMKLPKETDKIIEDEAEAIFFQSQLIVPVDTGTLQRSGTHDHSFLRSIIGYNTPYAAFVHDGTSRMEGQYYLSGPAQARLPTTKSKLEEILKK